MSSSWLQDMSTSIKAEQIIFIHELLSELQPVACVAGKGPMKVHRCISVYPSCVSTVADCSCQLVPMHHLSCKIVIVISGVVTSFSGFSTPEREDVYTRGESGVFLM